MAVRGCGGRSMWWSWSHLAGDGGDGEDGRDAVRDDGRGGGLYLAHLLDATRRIWRGNGWVLLGG